MTDFTRRTLRTWAVACALHGAAVAALVAAFVPWKTPAANVALLAWAALTIAAAPGLWLGKRWGWRLALASASLGLLACAVVLTGLLLSATYLRTVYGEFGTGASIGAFLLAAVVFEVLGIVPALLMRALLRREVRADLAARPLVPPAAAGAGLLLVALALPLALAARFGLSPAEPLSPEARAQAMAVLRAAVEGREAPPASALEGIPAPGPVYVTLWSAGLPAARVAGDGEDLAACVRQAAEALRSSRIRANAWGGRLKVDRVVAAAPVAAEDGLLLALGINPGLDGLRRAGAPALEALLPDDLVRMDAFGKTAPLPSSQELRLGLDTGLIAKRLGGKAGRLERFRAESFVESEGGPVAVERGNAPLPRTGPEAWRAAAIAGGDFLLRQQAADGSFAYQYFPYTDRSSGSSNSSLARHAGAAYSLAQLAGIAREERFAHGARKAIEWLLATSLKTCGQGRGCITRGANADLGESALTAVALLEYERRTEDPRFRPQAMALSEFLLSMQRPDGELHHRWVASTGQPDPEPRRMFASEQAALVFVLAHRVTGEQRFLEAARRLLDHLSGPRYDYFLGRFIYGADHWACIAVSDAYPHLNDPRYLDYCAGYCRFMGRLQYEPGEFENPGYEGLYGFSAAFVPQAPAAAGMTEAVVSACELTLAHGRRDEDLERQAALALDAMAAIQLRPENDWMARNPQKAHGGIRRSLVESEIRLDFTQHALSALLRGSELPLAAD